MRKPVVAILLLGLVSAGLTVRFCSSESRWYYPDEAKLEDFRGECLPIFEWLEDQKLANGRYPAELPDEFMNALKALDSLSEYHVDEQGEFFGVSIGSYYETGRWAYSYSSEVDEWGLQS